MTAKHTFTELMGRSLVLLLLTGIISLVVVERWWAPKIGGEEWIEIHARMPEAGGWIPGSLTAVAGQPLRLRLVSDDVVHSFGIGHSEQPPIHLEPGKPVETTLTFEQPGKYTYYCTRWCGVNHWRMRGTIEVQPGAQTPAKTVVNPANPPLYLILGLDIDAPHPAKYIPEGKPSSANGNRLGVNLPGDPYNNLAYLRSHSPSEVWEELRAEPSLKLLGDGQLWDLVSLLWQAQTTPERLAQGREIYAQDCAACHGEDGDGDGVMASALAAAGEDGPHTQGAENHLRQAPADFTDRQAMLGANSAILHGKIVRGGMGTGMPYWGPILTDEQIWAVVEYIWTFQFDLEKSKDGGES